MIKLIKRKIRYKSNKNYRLIAINTIIVLTIFILSIGWSTFSQILGINDITAKVRINADIRITNISIANNYNNGNSNWEEYNVKNISSGITLPHQDSSITFKVQITNFGNVEMGIFSISGLPNNLEYSLEYPSDSDYNYKLKDKICIDSNSQSLCSLGIQKDIYITIKYKDGRFNEELTDYQILLKFDFRSFHTVTYQGLGNVSGYPTEVMDGDNLEIMFLEEYKSSDLRVTIDGHAAEFNLDGKTLRIENVLGDVVIQYNGLSYFVDFMQKKSLGTDADLDFYDTNITSGIFLHDETKDDPYPVYYYRGDVDNSIIYAGHCWQIVRTTESGGLKLVYDGNVIGSDGKAISGDIDDNTIATCTDDHNYLGSEEFNYKVDGLASPSQVGYKYSVTAGIEKIVPSRMDDMGQVPEDISDKIPTNGVLIGKTADWDGSSYTINDAKTYTNDTARLIYKDAIDDVKEESEKRYYTCLTNSNTCDTVYYLYKRSGENVYAIVLKNNQSLDDAIKGKTLNVGVMFGHDVTWNESSKEYTLTNPITIEDLNELEDDIRGGDSGNYKNETPNAFHYTCLTNSNTCGTVYYIYYNDYGNYHDTYASGLYGIKLSDGKNIKEKLNEMLSESTNTTYSRAAAYINAWFEGDKANTDWRGGKVLKDNYLDESADDLWCNDREIAGYHGWDIDADNHASDNKYLHFDAFKRLVGEGDLKPTRPDITCDSKNDSFTVKNPAGNQSLEYPVAMLTADEAVLAGGIYGKKTNNYLIVRNGKKQFFMTPYYVSDDHTRIFTMAADGTIDSDYASTGYALRPAIVLKDIFTISGGTGTHDDPYQLTLNK